MISFIISLRCRKKWSDGGSSNIRRQPVYIGIIGRTLRIFVLNPELPGIILELWKPLANKYIQPLGDGNKTVTIKTT
jgi:hypothetical protein